MIVEILQFILLLAISPLIIGVIRKIKASFQCRKGASIFQPYFDLSKLFMKSSVISKDASWVFKVTPYVCIGASLVAALLVPVVIDSTVRFHRRYDRVGISPCDDALFHGALST